VLFRHCSKERVLHEIVGPALVVQQRPGITPKTRNFPFEQEIEVGHVPDLGQKFNPSAITPAEVACYVNIRNEL
jgi:hypothetical protein